jgi:hypothetical protein
MYTGNPGSRRMKSAEIIQGDSLTALYHLGQGRTEQVLGQHLERGALACTACHTKIYMLRTLRTILFPIKKFVKPVLPQEGLVHLQLHTLHESQLVNLQWDFHTPAETSSGFPAALEG